jgi:phytoene desaturase
VKRVVVVGGGLGGLAAAALIGRAGHRVTLLEANGWLGGKSRRIELGGRRIDTGPALLTFPGVLEKLLDRWDALGGGRGGSAREVSGLVLERLEEVGTYHYRGEVCSLPVPQGHPWHAAWERFVRMHGGLGADVTRLLTTDWYEPALRPSLLRLLKLYGPRPTTQAYLRSLFWLPDGLREILAIHTLNAGVSPARTPALYASMPAVMAADGVWAPAGGVYELVRALEKLARASGAEIRTSEPVRRIEQGRVTSESRAYPADVVVSGLDAGRLEEILVSGRPRIPGKLTCSGVVIYASLAEELPSSFATHSVVLPSDPDALYSALETREEPQETMAFVDYYRPGTTYPNDGPVLALGLTAPANGREYGSDDAFVGREVERVSRTLGLSEPLTRYFRESETLHPRYFELWGSPGGALYGEAGPFWRSGPLHRPRYSERKRPWLWRVGASVHPGGGVPAVLGGALICTGRLLRSLAK